MTTILGPWGCEAIRTWGSHGAAMKRRIQQPVAGVCRVVRGAAWKGPAQAVLRSGMEPEGGER